MSRVACLASVALLAGCAQSDAIFGPLPGEGAATGSGLSGDAGGDGRGGDSSGNGGDDDDSSGGGDDAPAAGSGGAGSAGDGGSTSQGGAGGAGNAGSGGAGGGAGAGGPSVCGDGVVGGVEECDDDNGLPDDGCSECVIDCEPQGAKSPLTGNCFRVFEDATTWPFAEANCAAWGGSPGLGHLASIASAAEQDLVFALISQRAWIGVQDPITEGVYQWSDGTVWNYEHWAPGEPDNTYEEDCAFMRTTDDGGWNDHACGDSEIPSYACERRGAGTF